METLSPQNISRKLVFPGNKILNLDRTYLMGILNVTPDSFSDGGRFNTAEKAPVRAMEMLGQGADIIDIGGESTRPGAEPVPLEAELERTIPVIRAIIREVPSALISIDTYKAVVAEAALKAGASMVNDISGLGFDENMAKVIARTGAPLIIMHIKGTPRHMQVNPEYADLIPEIIRYFRERIRTARSAGISSEQIIVDPGLGFGKTLAHNYEILGRLKEIQSLGYPVMLGPSRKSFIGKLGDWPVEERLPGTAAIVAAAALQNVSFVRVHDIREIKQVLAVCEAIKKPYEFN